MYSIVTTNRNRREHLTRVVGSWLAAPAISQIVVVDFGSTEPLSREPALAHDKIRIVRVANTDAWRPGLAINLGIDHARETHICKLDADAGIGDASWLARLDLDRRFYRGDYFHAVSHGQTVFAKADWAAIGGYHEWLSGYGFEDSDFYLRMRAAGIAEQLMAKEFLAEIAHGNEQRGKPDMATRYLAPRFSDLSARHEYMTTKNTYLAYLAPWNPPHRLRYSEVATGPREVTLTLAEFPRAYWRIDAFAHVLATMRLKGSEEQVKLINGLMSQFMGEDGGLGVRM